MRTLLYAVIGSAALHALSAAAWDEWKPTPAPPPPPKPRAAPRGPVIEVAWIDAPAPTPMIPAEIVTPDTATAKTASHRPPGPTAIATTATGTAPTTATATTMTGEPGPIPDRQPTGALTMRSSTARPDLSLPSSVATAIALAPPTAPRPDRLPTETRHPELKSDGGGWRSSDQGAFVAVIRPDGSVDIRDKPNVSVGVRLPTLKGMAQGLEAWADQPYPDGHAFGDGGRAAAVALANGTTPNDRAGIPRPPGLSHEDLARAAQGSDDKPSEGLVVPMIVVKFDLTDAVMRAAGMDPYLAAKKAFLDRTRDARVAIAAEHRTKTLRETRHQVRGQLEALWGRAELAPNAKRLAAFAMWDEAFESGSDAEREAGVQARRTVLDFLAAHACTAPAETFTDAELTALNARRKSRARFVPCPPPPPAPPVGPTAPTP